MPETKKANSKNIKRAVISILIGAAAGAVIFFLITALISVIICKNDISESRFGIIILIPSAVSGFICGYISVLPVKKNGLIIGLISSLALFFIIAAVSIFLSKSSISLTGWTAFGSAAACAGAAGVLCANQTSGKRKHKKSKNNKY
ncbi:MAG: TIGR04086 family membrane protein [Clostridia bacterium]|nr:TIGR04086 family membrane protein [Clostridia bacterium]